MRPYWWLNDDSRRFLANGYIPEGKSPEERIIEIANYADRIMEWHLWQFSSPSKGDPLSVWNAEKFVHYMAQGYYSLASPIWSNFGAGRGLPISCNGSHVADTMDSILDKVSEVGMMTKFGAGTSGFFGDLRPRGCPIRDGGFSSGPVHFMQLFDVVSDVISQGSTRRGNFVAYLPVDHPDILEFLEAREEGNPIKNISLGVCVSDSFLDRVKAKDPVALRVWGRIFQKRFETGYPYLFFTDNANRSKPKWYRDLPINSSNLCTEIMLPANENESFVCDLSSMNLALYDDWKNTDAVEVLTIFLDLVLSDYVDLLTGVTHMRAAREFAMNHRAIGIGVLGWHDLLQQRNLAFESYSAMQLNAEVFQFLDNHTRAATQLLGSCFGAAPIVAKARGVDRNATRLAIAPTTSSSFILGQTSPSIEPHHSNYYVKDLAKGKFTYKNPQLQRVLEELGKNTPEVWKSILLKGGSVQHLEFLSDQQKEVFKTFEEISQLTIIQQAAQRQRWIDQGQSVNLMIHPRTPVKDVNQLVLTAHELGLKSLYYQRSSNLAQEMGRNILECKSCES